jgi:hypothetical protein
LKHALQDAMQLVSAESETPDPSADASKDTSAEDEQLAMQLAERSVLHCVVQSRVGVHVVAQLLAHVDVHVASAIVVHDESHCCSSLAAQLATKLVVVHCLVQVLWVRSSQFASADTSMLPQAEMPA